jgi:hypothetical protein
MTNLALGLGTLTSRNSKFKFDVLSNSQSKFMMKNMAISFATLVTWNLPGLNINGQQRITFFVGNRLTTLALNSPRTAIPYPYP